MLTEKQLRRLLLANGYSLCKVRGADLYRIRDNRAQKYVETDLSVSDVWSVAKYYI